jgi:hypothetical protein
VQDGYLTIEGKVTENVYPTVAALRWQDPRLSERSIAPPSRIPSEFGAKQKEVAIELIRLL